MDLHTKCRPKLLKEVVGQPGVVSSLKAKVRRGEIPHALLFHGPSGCGKTTLARIIATKVGCKQPIEVDAATHGGIDDARKLFEGASYKDLSGDAKCYIIDEAHALSRQAWQALLKTLEEPPDHVFIILCTTEVAKVPRTIQTRCARYKLSEVSRTDLADLIDSVRQREGIDLADESIIDLIARESMGSPRQALVYLDMVSAAQSRKDAVRIIAAAEQTPDAHALCRVLVDAQSSPKAKWQKAHRLLSGMQDASPESIRLIVLAYVTKAALGSKPEACGRYLRIIDEFSRPTNASEGLAPILLATWHSIREGGD